MAKIQQGDFLTAKPNVASRNDISSVVNSLANVLNTGISVTQQANQSKLANNQIDLANKALAINNEINVKYQADPTNPEREREFRERFDMLAQEYKVNPLVEGQWGRIKDGVYNNFSQYNAKWQIQQQQTNAQSDLKQGYEKLIDQVSMMGSNNASIDEVRLVYNNGIESLRNGANAVLGSVVTESFLNDANHDYMASYIGALAMNNPLQAQALMEDEGVLNDIGNAETIEKLNSYIATSFAQQSKKEAVKQLGNALRALSSQEANDLINGNANINQLMRFNQKFKNINNGSKEMLYSIYGIPTKNKFYYDSNKKTIEQAKEGKSGESLGNLKLTTEQKMEMADTLQTDLHNMLTMFEENPVDVKQLKTFEDRKKGGEVVKGYMDTIAYMQGRIDTACATKAITKDERNRLINDFILPASEYLENNIEQLDQGAFLKGKLGYDLIKKQFNTEGLKGKELQDMQRDKLFAQNYYLDELHKVVQKIPNLKSIYDIERLSGKAQKEIYQTASENAIKRAQRWTSRPEIFFAQEFPQYYSVPFKMHGAQKALEINNNVAQAVYKARYEGINDKELSDIAESKMREYINKEAMARRRQAGELLLRDIDSILSNPLPKNYIELKNEIERMGFTMGKFKEFAYEKGYVDNSTSLMRGYMSKGYMNALLDIRRMNNLKK